MLNYFKNKRLRSGLLCGFMLTFLSGAYAATLPSDDPGGIGESGGGLGSEIATLLTNLGAYLGYAIGTPTTPNSSLISQPSQTLTSLKNLILMQLGTIMTPNIVDPSNPQPVA
jgi:hypothetical protein